jgi:hypothetical protein
MAHTRRQTHTHRSKQKNNGTYRTINTYTQRSKQKKKSRFKTIKTYTQIKAKEQRHTQGDKHIHTDKKQ